MFNPQMKLLYHLDRINEWMQGKDARPILVEFDPSNACNMKCDFCTFDYMKDKQNFPSDKIDSTLKGLKEAGVKSINWTGGGEPLCHPKIAQFFETANRLGIDQGIFTNGGLLTEELTKLILKTHVWMRFSIDCASKENFAKIKGVDSWDRINDNIRQAVELKKEFESNCTVGVGFVITPDNHHEIPKIAKLAEEWAVDYVQYKPMIQNVFKSAQLEREWWDNSVIPLLKDAEKISSKCVINLYKLHDLRFDYNRGYDKCYGHYFVPVIGADGNVWLCTHLRGIEGYSFGNLKEKSFNGIWNSKQRQDAISRIDFKKCQACCRNNEINKVLHFMKHPQQELHPNFI